MHISFTSKIPQFQYQVPLNRDYLQGSPIHDLTFYVRPKFQYHLSLNRDCLYGWTLLFMLPSHLMQDPSSIPLNSLCLYQAQLQFPNNECSWLRRRVVQTGPVAAWGMGPWLLGYTAGCMCSLGTPSYWPHPLTTPIAFKGMLCQYQYVEIKLKWSDKSLEIFVIDGTEVFGFNEASSMQQFNPLHGSITTLQKLVFPNCHYYCSKHKAQCDVLPSLVLGSFPRKNGCILISAVLFSGHSRF